MSMSITKLRKARPSASFGSDSSSPLVGTTEVGGKRKKEKTKISRENPPPQSIPGTLNASTGTISPGDVGTVRTSPPTLVTFDAVIHHRPISLYTTLRKPGIWFLPWFWLKLLATPSIAGVNRLLPLKKDI
ncbi:hypothetical protein TWF217_008504 [Orbilia oligospora]|nr:hypothetical protein TWF751_002384 [Orbilia oligospora]KAF3243291.1 hypothetical protein TWF128_010268 [Orbilia oligospora]KAF3250895.1 hypothetical protein TWF217_008504 [Orbilia oligospora]KAF3291745.1 hypothetical protein TWF132_006492 [Orbilia oligospora]